MCSNFVQDYKAIVSDYQQDPAPPRILLAIPPAQYIKQSPQDGHYERGTACDDSVRAHAMARGGVPAVARRPACPGGIEGTRVCAGEGTAPSAEELAKHGDIRVFNGTSVCIGNW